MIKTFITVMSEQPRGNLRETKYIAAEDERLFYDKEISFPILTAMNAYANEDDEIKIIVITNEDLPQTEEYYKNNFIPALEEIKAEKNLKELDVSKIIKIEAEISQGIVSNLKVAKALLDKIGDNEILHACITFGTKPLPIILFMALNYAYKVRNNTDIETIVYGAKYWGDKKEQVDYIYDVTSLFYTNEMFMNLANAGVEDPAGKVKALYNILDEE